jgi:hypothetical protein
MNGSIMIPEELIPCINLFEALTLKENYKILNFQVVLMNKRF